MIYLIGIVVLLILIFLKILTIKHRPALKTNKKFHKANVRRKLLCCKCTKFNFLEFNLVKYHKVNFLKFCDNVITKAKLNLPKIQGFIDKQKLIENNLMFNKPIYLTQTIIHKEHILFSMRYCDFVWIVVTQDKYILQQKNLLEENNNVFIFDKSKISKEKLNLLFLLNINYGKEEKVLFKNYNQFSLNNISIDNFYRDIDNNNLILKTIIDGTEIIVNKFNFYGEYCRVVIKNLENKNKFIKFNFSKKIKQNLINYYVVKNNKNIVNVYNIFGELLFNINKPVDMLFDFSEIENKKLCNMPIIGLKTAFELLGNEQRCFEFSIALDNQSYKDKFIKYCSYIKKLFALKIKSVDKTFELYFNTILPKQIILDMIEKNIFEKREHCPTFYNFEQLLESYRQNLITAIEMYSQIVDNLLGIKENDKTFYISPKIKFSTTIFKYGKKLVEIKVLGKEKYIEIEGVKYYNFFCIPKTKISEDDAILLVI